MIKNQASLDLRPPSMFAAARITKCATALLTMFVFVAVCRSEDQREDASTAETPVIASNQSVSIDDPVSQAPVETVVSNPTEAKSAVAKVTTDAPAAEKQNKTAGLDRSTGVAASPPGRIARRSARDGVGATRAAPVLPDVPWYRTGIGALGIVLGVIGLAVWSIRRWIPTLSGGGCTVLNVVGRAGLSPKHSVALIAMGRRFVLVGLSGERIAPICEVTDPQEVAELTLRLGREAGNASAPRSSGKEQAFESLLDGEVEEYAKTPGASGQGATATSGAVGHATREPLNALLTRLRSLKLK